MSQVITIERFQAVVADDGYWSFKHASMPVRGYKRLLGVDDVLKPGCLDPSILGRKPCVSFQYLDNKVVCALLCKIPRSREGIYPVCLKLSR